MIFDTLDNAEQYSALHPFFARAFDFMKTASALKNGRYELDGENMYAIVSDNDLRKEADMESHKKYIDIQLVLSGKEIFRCSPVERCHKISKYYDESADIMFYGDEHEMEYQACEGMFSIFFPQDAHAPLIGEGKVRKIIIKIKKSIL